MFLSVLGMRRWGWITKISPDWSIQHPTLLMLIITSNLVLVIPLPKSLTVWITEKCVKFWKRWEHQTTWSASWEMGMQVREGNGKPLQYSCLENPMDGGAWQAAFHGVAKSRLGLSKFTFTFHFQAMEKEMATHSSVLAWRIPGTAEPGGLLSMGSHRVGHDWSDLAVAAAAGSNS